MSDINTNAKTLSDLREAIGMVVGDIMSPSYLMYLRKFADQFSSVYQIDPARALDRIEIELNKFGYSLLLEDDYGVMEGEGSEDFVIYVVATGNPVKNVYMQFDYEEVSGQQYAFRQDGGKLRYDVYISFEKIDVEMMDELLSAGQEGDIGMSDSPDFDTEVDELA